MITRSTCDNIHMITVSDGLSDHHTVIVDDNFSRTVAQSKYNVSYRPIHKIDIDTSKANKVLHTTLSEIQIDTRPT